jgi:AraC-like DNA-binding protein
LNSIAELSAFVAAERPAPSGPSAPERRILCQDVRGVIGTCEVAGSALNSSAASIFLIDSGQLRIERDDGSIASFGAGAMLLCVGGRALRANWEHARFSHVQLSPQRLAQLLDGAPAGRTSGIESLHHHGLAPFLVSQVDMLKRRGAKLAPTDLEHVFEGIFQTAEALLKGAFARRTPTTPCEPASERLRAVHRFIERNLHRQDLSVSDVALGANISRASLYRLFDTQAHSVHATLREQRLQKGLSYLERARSDGLSIGAIAHACGFSDQAVFSKLFRRRFGITPRQARSSSSAQAPQARGHQFR